MRLIQLGLIRLQFVCGQMIYTFASINKRLRIFDAELIKEVIRMNKEPDVGLMVTQSLDISTPAFRF